MGGANGSSVKSSGLLTAATAPRFQYNPANPAACLGLFVEAAVQNVIAYSETVGGTGWSNYNGGNQTLNAATSPRGDTTASQIGPTNGLGGCYGGTGPQITAGVTYTTSAFFKWVSGSTPLQLVVAGSQAFGNGGDRVVNFDGSTGTFISKSSDVSAYKIEQYPNGWWRVSGTFVATASSTNVPIALYAGQQGTTYQAWGAQLETRSTSSSYISNPGATRNARSADAVSFTVPGGVSTLTYTFDDGSTQAVTISAGAYTVPTTLNRAIVASITGS